MIALILTVLAASLLGSLHCAGMCGAFVVLCSGEPGAPPTRTATLQSAYHAGRLVTYAALGAVAGGFGAALDLGGAVFGLQRVAIALAGVTLVVVGLMILMGGRGPHGIPIPLPAALQRIVRAGHTLAFRLPPLPRATLIGLMSTLLPCGWLYAFVLTAAGTGAPLLGAITMAAFWVGTLPVLIGVATGAQVLAGPLRRHLPKLTAIALVLVGGWALAGRLRVPALTTTTAVPASLETLADHVHQLDAEDSACCRDAE
ncbi:MAG: sulfite exporter TauE/SafE family protein [Phycisphaerales bacterium]|nr:sulfite exporter TauE/SafE family protein [Phycisphaerae bacterium]NNF41533.1 sulfite exporter TauE/SafE family protein [Phycisphaerales bacterium]NNM26638.1 sulfite exporter TauE/SafE family protein [Phycisphaerales bacterium]